MLTNTISQNYHTKQEVAFRSFFCRLTLPTNFKRKKSHLNELLLKALITSNIPFRFVENPFFKQFREELVQSPFNLLNQFEISNNILPQMHAKHELSLMRDLNNQDNLTLSLDGWTDVSGNSIYAMLLLCGQYFKRFVEILDLNCIQHTSNNILKAKTSHQGQEYSSWKDFSSCY
ncbi:hypothetical protein O181_070164 [Austropuccinia psidii MF-1]|uniref:DUF659 domain-containing protein n=1 Tax=Austropuccinia psidii MF-1 TaxID=1389203 RepID=A0A9Q3F0Q4_9BASI|nr:hypothetical protein [Austropuccinia psidii MF-1]